MSRSALRLTAALSALAVIGVTTSPALAAEPAAEAASTAAILTIAGSAVDSGQYTAVNDGKRETTSGLRDPQVADVLSGQSNVDIGVLYQNASTEVANRRGTARACSGVAGNGAVVVEVGDGDCLTGGDAVSLLPGSIALGDTTLIESVLLAPLVEPLQATLGQALTQQVLGPLSGALNQTLGSLGDLGIVVESAGAVQASCVATSRGSRGYSNVGDLRAYVDVAGQEVELLNLPVGNLDPNTKVVTDLDEVVSAVLRAVEIDLDNTLGGALAPLGLIVPQINQVTDIVLGQLGDALTPLQDNVLDITLNKQSSNGARQIEVTALDLQLLPAAQQFIDSSLASVELGKVACAGGVASADEPDDPSTPTDPADPTTPPVNDEPAPKPTPTVPISVPAGYENVSAPWAPVALLGMTLLAIGAGAYSFRKALSQR